ncbi:hypothetical protein YQE_11325, partial [Dendroctonus ponderosae]
MLDDLNLETWRNVQWFQHDDAPPHNFSQVRDHLDVTFPGAWIGRNGPILWPPRSPDLSPLDFFLWGTVKNTVYQNKYSNLNALKEAVRPGPIPGRRPTIGLPGEIAPSKISNYGLMGVLMPIYTIAFIIFFTYIVKKIVYKKKPINYVGSPLYPPCDSDEQFEEQVFQANPHYFNRPNKDTSKIGKNIFARNL